MRGSVSQTHHWFLFAKNAFKIAQGSTEIKLLLSTLFQVSPLPKNRSPQPSSGGGGSAFARWSTAYCGNGNMGSRPCQTYENLDFLYRNPPANSAPAGASAPPPLPAKCMQRGEFKCLELLHHLWNLHEWTFLHLIVFTMTSLLIKLNYKKKLFISMGKFSLLVK